MYSKFFKKTIGGLKTKTIVIPVVIILLLLHAFIIYTVVTVNDKSDTLSIQMRNYAKYSSEATSILAGSSVLSETSTSFVLMPLLENGELNIGPLIAYTTEMSNPRRGYQVYENFKNYSVSPVAIECVKIGAECANNLLNLQLHAIALIDSVYHIPNIPTLDDLPRYELNETEKALTNEEKIALSKQILFSQDNSTYKAQLSENIGKAASILQNEANELSDKIIASIITYRIFLWVAIVSIAVVLVITFGVLFKLLISPLGGFTVEISNDNALQDARGLFEVRLLASAYNGLLKRRNKLENVLRSQAETDALTNLPNRYSYNQYLLNSEESDYSFVIVLFDVNYLKETNDTYGHATGDVLIKNTAQCITTSFKSLNENKCFRFGGDEFACIAKNISKEDVKKAIETFKEKQKEYNISVAYGYGYTDEISKTNFDELFNIADKHMYQNKLKTHEELKKAKGDK